MRTEQKYYDLLKSGSSNNGQLEIRINELQNELRDNIEQRNQLQDRLNRFEQIDLPMSSYASPRSYSQSRLGSTMKTSSVPAGGTNGQKFFNTQYSTPAHGVAFLNTDSAEPTPDRQMRHSSNPRNQSAPS